MRANRLLSLMLSLQATGRVTAQELSARLEVSERTIYRDVAALSMAGIPVYTQSGTNGGIFLDENYRISLTGLSIPQIRSLFVAGDVGPLADLGLQKASEETILKLLAALPAIHRHEVERLRRRFYIDTAHWFQFGDTPSLLPQLQQAVWEDRQISIEYENYEGRLTTSILDAYALVAKANVWYLVACENGADARTYRVSRIRQLTLRADHFQRDPQFDLAAYWKETSQNFEKMRMREFPFYPVQLHVAPYAAAHFRDYMPDRFEQIDGPNLRGWLTLRVLFLSPLEARMCILGLGTHVTVIEPTELQDMVLKTAREVVNFAEKRIPNIKLTY